MRIDFSAVIGNDSVKLYLSHIFRCGQVGHAYTFEGIQGIGRLKMAKAFATALVGGDSWLHPDINLVTNDLYSIQKSTNSLLVDTIRAMKTDAYIKPYQADKKIYIIPNAQTLTIEAQNSLLKLLEDPPHHCVIILIVQNSNLLLNTVSSRTHIVRFLAISQTDIEQYLKEKLGDSKYNRFIAQISNGSLDYANKLIQNQEFYDVWEKVLDMLYSYHSSIKLVYDFLLFFRKNKAISGDIFDITLKIFYSIMQRKINVQLFDYDETEKMKKFNDKITLIKCVKCIEIVVRYMQCLDNKASYNLLVHNFCLNLWEVLK